jgi:Uma2 family endonuclease
MAISEKAFCELALGDPSGHWELHCGVPRQKPGMTAQHDNVLTQLFGSLFTQLDGRQFRVRGNAGHVRTSADRYYIPDVFVLPTELFRARQPLRELEVYDSPLPLVVEIWSPSTGDYDIEAKLPQYERRGDLEIWYIHPYDRTLTAWRRQPDGSYVESIYTGGQIQPVALPGVTIGLGALFD